MHFLIFVFVGAEKNVSATEKIHQIYFNKNEINILRKKKISNHTKMRIIQNIKHNKLKKNVWFYIQQTNLQLEKYNVYVSLLGKLLSF